MTARRSTPLALALAFAAAGLAAAAPAPPPPKPATPIHFPAFQERTLGNGLRVVVVEQHESPAVSLRLVVDAGKVFVPAAKAGLAQATAALLREGTASRSSQQIAEAIDSIGGDLSAGASWETGFVAAQVTSDQLDRGLELLADVVLHPTFPAEEIERWRRQTLGALQVEYSDPAYLAGAAVTRLVYRDHPYGQPDDGTPASVQALSRDDLVAFHRRQYVPNGAILAVVGDVKAADAFAKVERALGAWAKGEEFTVPKVAAAAGEGLEILIVDKPDAVQTEIRAGQVGIAYNDDDHFTARVYNSIVGGGAGGRLYREIRQQRGLSYGAYSNFVLAEEPGAFTVSTFTKTESTVEVVGLVLDILKQLAVAAVPADELGPRKTYISGAFPIEIETPDGIATKVVEALRFGRDRAFLESYRQRIDAVTSEQVQDFAKRRIHPDRLRLVLVGNGAAFAEEVEKRWGKATRVPFAELDLLRPDLRQPAATKPAG